MLVPNFEEIAMVDGVLFEGAWGDAWTNSVHSAGQISFPSGRVVVADALASDFDRELPLDRAVPRGPHDVFFGVAAQSPSDTLVVAAWVRFSKRAVRTWVPAFSEGYEPDDTYIPGFGVDSGTACIADLEQARSVCTEAAGERLLHGFVDGYEPGIREALFHPDTPDSFFACSSGLGDGFYSAFWGLDVEGAPTYLVVDFDLLVVPIWESFELDLPLRRGRVTAPLLEKAGAKIWVPRLPIFGKPILRVRHGHPRVRVLREGHAVPGVTRRHEHGDALYDIEWEPGDRLEVSFRIGKRLAEVLEGSGEDANAT
jgi:hypothetical protein